MSTKELINQTISKLGFSLDSFNYDYCNVIQSCGTIGCIPKLVKLNGHSIIIGNIHITMYKVGDLKISYHISLGLNIKKKHCRNWNYEHRIIKNVHHIDFTDDDIEQIKKDIFESVKSYKKLLGGR